MTPSQLASVCSTRAAARLQASWGRTCSPATMFSVSCCSSALRAIGWSETDKMTVILMDIGDMGSHERLCESELADAVRMGKGDERNGVEAGTNRWGKKRGNGIKGKSRTSVEGASDVCETAAFESDAARAVVLGFEN